MYIHLLANKLLREVEMDFLDIEKLIEQLRSIGKDTQTCEVKESVGKLPASTVETLSAFSNGVGGTLILGLAEKDNFSLVTGFNAVAMQDALASACEKLTPVVRPDITIYPFEGAEILVAYIPEMPIIDRPCFIRDRGMYRGSYIRTGDGDRLMTTYEVDRMKENNRQPQWDAEVVSEATMDDLDSNLLNGLIQRQRSLHPRIFRHLSDNDVLLNLRAIVDDEGVLRPTLAGLLALGIYPQKYFPTLVVRATLYPDPYQDAKQSMRFLDSKTLVGPISDLLVDAFDFVSRNTRMGAVVDGAFRKDVPDYPSEAIREAIANALQHRDYSSEGRASSVNLNIYADRIEILNPGGLYGRMTMENLGQPGNTASRNQFLSSILETTPAEPGRFVVENRGSGLPSIEKSLTEAGMYPAEIKNSLTTFKITFDKRRKSEIEKQIFNSENLREVIIKTIREHGTSSVRELADASGLSRQTIYKRIQALLTEGVLETTEPLRSPRQRYRIKR